MPAAQAERTLQSGGLGQKAAKDAKISIRCFAIVARCGANGLPGT